MKKIFISNLLFVLFIIIVPVALMNCSSSKSTNASTKKVAEWYNSHAWLKGLQLIPHESINQQEFSKQYHKNPAYWDEAFNFLKTHNLNELAPGTYIIDSNNVIATVSEVAPKNMNDVNWEAHRNFNDLQYIIKGKARMGIASISDPTARVIVPYTPADNETFSVDGGKYYDAEPGTFFIFSPQEIHRPAFKVEGYDIIKKIVIKVRVA
jgi:biofilm protein TabA